MNFLFLNSASRGWGGNEQSIILTAEILAARHQVVFAYREEEIGSHVAFPKYRLPFLFEGDLYTIAGLAAIVRRHHIDVIIPSKRKDYAIAGIVSRLCDIVNIIWLGARRELKNNRINRLVYRSLADGMIVNAQRIKEALTIGGLVQEQNIKVLYRGINSTVLDRYRISPRQERGTTMVITAMGRLDKNKSHDLLLQGFARFLNLRPGIEARLQILGEGNERARLEQLIGELGIGERVRLRGFVSDPYPDLAESDVFAMTSESEGLSIALLEAMYLGNAPVSTFAGGGVTEIITDGQNGLLFNYGDYIALANHFMKLYLEPEWRRQIGKSAHTSVSERYSANRIEQEIVAFCSEIKANRHQ